MINRASTTTTAGNGSGCGGYLQANSPNSGTYNIYNGATSMTYLQQTYSTVVGRQLSVSFWTKWAGRGSISITTSVSIQP
ncbi:hypothetical protein I4U23_004073 [Adineta vaga]|nr:hypothetical protein I4U23_004073 [Adineta vaga]